MEMTSNQAAKTCIILILALIAALACAAPAVAGEATPGPEEDDASVLDLTLNDSAKLIMTGYISSGESRMMAIWQYDIDDTPDVTFNRSGRVTHYGAAGGGGDDAGYAVLVDQEGRILVTGQSSNGTDGDMVLWRYNSDGTLDSTFNGRGFVTHDSAAGGHGDDSGHVISTDSDGMIIVSGYSDNGTDEDMVLWRYNSNGTLDNIINFSGILLAGVSAGEGILDPNHTPGYFGLVADSCITASK
jgi:uncharacterized delta-60 repeat protein